MLAAAGRVVSEPRQRDIGKMITRINEEHGLWRCHAAFECSEVCPANVDPAREIMNLRSKILRSSSRTRIEGSA
jgi:succinate dehydrogenase / fumarate reductase iron-sulfur subunit